MIIYHIAFRSAWEQAKAVGEYRISTRGRTLDDEGFIHCCYVDQVATVARVHYRGVDQPLVLLEIDTSLLGSEVIAENVGGGIELFPHVYGPIPVDAVQSAEPIDLDGEVVTHAGDDVNEPERAGLLPDDGERVS